MVDGNGTNIAFSMRLRSPINFSKLFGIVGSTLCNLSATFGEGFPFAVWIGVVWEELLRNTIASGPNLPFLLD